MSLGFFVNCKNNLPILNKANLPKPQEVANNYNQFAGHNQFRSTTTTNPPKEYTEYKLEDPTGGDLDIYAWCKRNSNTTTICRFIPDEFNSEKHDPSTFSSFIIDDRPTNHTELRNEFLKDAIYFPEFVDIKWLEDMIDQEKLSTIPSDLLRKLRKTKTRRFPPMTRDEYFDQKIKESMESVEYEAKEMRNEVNRKYGKPTTKNIKPSNYGKGIKSMDKLLDASTRGSGEGQLGFYNCKNLFKGARKAVEKMSHSEALRYINDLVKAFKKVGNHVKTYYIGKFSQNLIIADLLSKLTQLTLQGMSPKDALACVENELANANEYNYGDAGFDVNINKSEEDWEKWKMYRSNIIQSKEEKEREAEKAEIYWSWGSEQKGRRKIDNPLNALYKINMFIRWKKNPMAMFLEMAESGYYNKKQNSPGALVYVTCGFCFLTIAAGCYCGCSGNKKYFTKHTKKKKHPLEKVKIDHQKKDRKKTFSFYKTDEKYDISGDSSLISAKKNLEEISSMYFHNGKIKI